jgi:hypothetical protein
MQQHVDASHAAADVHDALGVGGRCALNVANVSDQFRAVLRADVAVRACAAP